jgi:hypothetical protein
MSENEKLNEIIKNHDCNDLLERQRLYLQYLDESLSLKQVMKDLSKIHLLKHLYCNFSESERCWKISCYKFL